MRARVVALILVAVLAFYLVVIGQRAWLMIQDDRTTMRLLGIAVLLLPIIGTWAIWRELRIGFGSQELAQRLTAEGGMPQVSLSFAECKADVQAHPEDWRAWYRLAVAYGDAGDTRHGRQALQRAMELAK